MFLILVYVGKEIRNYTAFKDKCRMKVLNKRKMQIL